MSSPIFYKKTAQEIANIPIVDGQLFFETDQGNNGRILLDNDNTRLQIGGNFLPTYSVTFDSGNWSTTAPYFQTVTVNGIRSTDKPIPTLNVTNATSETSRRNMQINYNYIWYFVTEDNAITAVCMYTKPLTNITINFRGN